MASWNWCSRNEGVSYEDLQAQHEIMVSEVEKDSNGLSGWIIMAPQTGAANASTAQGRMPTLLQQRLN